MTPNQSRSNIPRRERDEGITRSKTNRCLKKRQTWRFSLDCDTETNFSTSSRDLCSQLDQSSEECKCQGPYQHIREGLDYNYHSYYRKERQWLQDSIIDKLVNEIVKNPKDGRKKEKHKEQQQVLQSSSSNSLSSLQHSMSNNNLTARVSTDQNGSIIDPSVRDNVMLSNMNLVSRSSRHFNMDASTHSHSSKIVRRQSFNNEDSSIHSRRAILSPDDVDDVLISLPTDPWLIYVVGTQSVSKSDAISTLMKQNHFPILSFVLVDPNEIQNLLPECHNYINKHGEEVASQLLMKETGYIAEIVTEAVIEQPINAITFTSFQNVHWYKEEYFPKLKQKFKTLKIAILHVLSNNERVDVSNEEDEEKDRQYYNKRILSQDLQESQRIFEAVDELKQDVDCYCLLEMNSTSNEVTIQSKGMTWESFDKIFEQESALHTHDDNIRRRRCSNEFVQYFDVLKSTEENYKSNDMSFHGAYAHLRKLLDYNYHENYRKHRQILQDAIIRDTLNAAEIIDNCGQRCTTPTVPFLVFTAGKAILDDSSYIIFFCIEYEEVCLSSH